MPQPARDRVVAEGKFFALISYISFLCVITLLLKKDNKFAAFHAKQGLVIFVFEVAGFILSMLPFFGLFIRMLALLLFTLASVRGIFASLAGEYTPLPVISGIADKIFL
jgi:uncharacterized membrane protein